MLIIILFLFFAILTPAVSIAQSIPEPTRAEFPGPIDPAAVKAFMDSMITPRIRSGDIPGAVVVVIKDGRDLFRKGYGYGNMDGQAPVNPDSTMFYLGSVTKPFTATAVMQLVEQGRLDLHADVNRYLTDFKLPDTYPKPVTLAHLLTHTGGFDDKNIGYAALTADEAIPLGRYLATDMPPRVMPPGMVSSYSNHGYGLAGYLVEQVSGMAYADYIERHIFQPLGMRQSMAHLPPPASTGHIAVGYDYDYRAGRLNPAPLGYRNLPPAGSLCVTAADMARFMIAHLQDGRYGDHRILSEDTAREMRRRQFTHHPRLPGVAFGFFERFRGHMRSLEHAGGYIGFSTYLALAPEEQLGVFVAINKTYGGSSQIVSGFLDRYYPVPPSSTPAAYSASGLERFAGTYHWTRYSRHSVEKIAIWDDPVHVSIDAGGQLLLRPAQGVPTVWRPITPDLFQRIDREAYLTFREEDDRVTHLFLSQGGSLPVALERLAWYDDVVVNRPAALVMIMFFLSACTLWPLVILVRAVIRRLRKAPRTTHATHRPAALLAGIVSLLNLAFFIGLDTWLGNSAYRLRLIYGMTPEMVVMLWLPIISVPLTLAVVCLAIRAWQRGTWSMAGRVYYSLVALVGVVYPVFLYHWNLLGFLY